MIPKLIHQKAMDYSFRAKQALEEGKHSSAFELYIKAAELESKVAEFYFDKPESEPTRSVIIRSAAFLNTNDQLIKDQLNNALELAVSLGNMPAEAASGEYNYINLLRQRSVHYILEPSSKI